MSRPKAIQYIRPDLTAVICSWHIDSKKADDWAEQHGYEITHGICMNCLDKFKADSIKNSSLAIKI